MKKYLLLICTISICAFSFSQMTSKNGHSILPEEGDWAIQMNGLPLINLALNAADIMSNSGAEGEHPSYVTGFSNVIVGKYFNSSDFATRYKIAFNSSSTTTREFDDDPTTAEENDEVLIYRMTEGWWDLKFGYGHEYRRGHNRLQGFYGYEGMIGLSRGDDDERNQSWSYKFEYDEMVDDISGSSFNDKIKQGLGISLEARAFVGVEYFAAPKISIGAEFGWGLELIMTGRGYTESTTVLEDNVDTDKDPLSYSSERSAKFAVDNMSGAVTATFHF